MFKFLVLVSAIYAVNAGLILEHKPALIAVSHGATSHQNVHSIAVHPVPVVAHKTVAVHTPVIAHVAHAPIVAHAPALSHATVVHHPVHIGLHH